MEQQQQALDKLVSLSLMQHGLPGQQIQSTFHCIQIKIYYFTNQQSIVNEFQHIHQKNKYTMSNFTS